MNAALAFLIGYVLGSIPFGLLLTRLFNAGDLRTLGSGNIGATNVLRTGHKGLAAATLVLDAMKGAVAVLLAGHLFGEDTAPLAGLAAFLGHIYPLWLGFRGGKGVATYLGALLALAPLAGLAFAVIWSLIAAVSRFSSLAALLASLATPVALMVLNPSLAGLFSLMTIALWWTHRPNLHRLQEGTEPRIGQDRS